MFKVFVAGAAGKIGHRLVKLLADQGHRVGALHRKPEQAEPLRAVGAHPLYGSLTGLDAPGLAKLMAGNDVVIFTAGAGCAGIELTNAIDGEGLALSVDAARLAGVRRFILVSAFPEAARGSATSEGFENYMQVKKRADVYLASSDLDWVIVRPGTLVDRPGTGAVKAGLAIPYGEIPRDDVAAFLLGVVGQTGINRKIIELTEGDVPVGEAVAGLEG